MKIATKAAFILGAGLGLAHIMPGVAMAAQTMVPPPSGMVASNIAAPPIPGSDNAEPRIMPPTMPVASPPAIALPDPAPADKADAKDPTKVPDSVKNMVKELDSSTKNITLEDLNGAREAVAKLDVLIDIQKRMNDLAKLRSDHDENKSVAAALPASALGMNRMPFPPLPLPNQAMGMPGTPSMMPMAAPEVTVVQIVGANGHYVAMIKSGEGKPSRANKGDKLPDGSVVKEITDHGVVLVRDNKKRTIGVKDAGPIFGGL